MTEPHVIRLRGPWLLEPLHRDVHSSDGQHQRQTADLPPSCKVQVPGDWREPLGADFLGCARYTRHFNCPTNLGPDQRVWLALDGVDYQAAVALNGHPLGLVEGYEAAARIDITGILESHNVLAVEVSLPPAVFHDPKLRGGRAGLAGGLTGEVRLEIGTGNPPR